MNKVYYALAYLAAIAITVIYIPYLFLEFIVTYKDGASHGQSS